MAASWPLPRHRLARHRRLGTHWPGAREWRPSSSRRRPTPHGEAWDPPRRTCPSPDVVWHSPSGCVEAGHCAAADHGSPASPQAPTKLGSQPFALVEALLTRPLPMSRHSHQDIRNRRFACLQGPQKQGDQLMCAGPMGPSLEALDQPANLFTIDQWRYYRVQREGGGQAAPTQAGPGWPCLQGWRQGFCTTLAGRHVPRQAGLTASAQRHPESGSLLNGQMRRQAPGAALWQPPGQHVVNFSEPAG